MGTGRSAKRGQSVSGSIGGRADSQTIDHITAGDNSGTVGFPPCGRDLPRFKADVLARPSLARRGQTIHIICSRRPPPIQIRAGSWHRNCAVAGIRLAGPRGFSSASGATYTRTNGKFGSPDGYFGMNIDYNWFRTGKPLAPSFRTALAIGVCDRALNSIYSGRETVRKRMPTATLLQPSCCDGSGLGAVPLQQQRLLHRLFGY